MGGRWPRLPGDPSLLVGDSVGGGFRVLSLRASSAVERISFAVQD